MTTERGRKMKRTNYKCCKCGQLWRYLPHRKFNDNLCNNQCDCKHFIDLHHCSLIDEGEE